MIDSHLMLQLESLMSTLSSPISVIDKDLLSDNEQNINVEELVDGVAQQIGEKLYYPINQPSVVLVCSADIPGAKDILNVASALVANVGSGHLQQESIYDIYRHILRGEITGSELDTTASEYDIIWDRSRCVMVLHMVQTYNDTAYDFLRDITPLQDKDVLVDIDRHNVALIKETTEVENEEELIQYALALQETLIEETAHTMTVGIGSNCHTADLLAQSFNEAKKAIEVGHMFKADESIFCYDRLILERFLLELPKDVTSSYNSLLFNRRTSRLFNEEMMYTIQMFFKKDLNLSDTARQLYIHRNTLVYRLDKVQRLTGLDLRKFDDAVTFKILMELKKSSSDSSNL